MQGAAAQREDSISTIDAWPDPARLGMNKLNNKYVVRSPALAIHLVTRPRQVAAITPGHATFDTCMSQPLSNDN